MGKYIKLFKSKSEATTTPYVLSPNLSLIVEGAQQRIMSKTGYDIDTKFKISGLSIETLVYEDYVTSKEPLWDARIAELNCVFYAPLSKDDFTDHIGLSTGSYFSSTSTQRTDHLTWSDENKSYLFDVGTSGENGLRFPLQGLQLRMCNGDYLTQVSKIKAVDAISTIIYILCSGYSTVSDGLASNLGYGLGHLVNKRGYNDSEFVTCAITLDGVNRVVRYYFDGIEYTLASNTPYFPSSDWRGFLSNWKDSYFDFITLAGSYGGNFQTKGYIKDVYLFNRILSIAELQEISLHEYPMDNEVTLFSQSFIA